MAGSSGQSDIRLMFYEDCDEMLETEALSGIVRRQSKYGSTSSSHTNHFPNQKLVTHVVQPHDTLPGLALKYSVTMEQIRRANRMYTSDSLFCKSVLSIPVPVQDSSSASLHNDLVPEPVAGSSASPQVQIKGQHRIQIHHQQNSHSHKKKREEQRAEISNSPDSWSSMQMSDPCNISLTKINGKDPPATSRRKVATQSADKVSEETANDFLHRIDSSIAKTRDQLEKKVSAAGVSYSYSENDLFNLNQPASANVPRSRSVRFKSTLPPHGSVSNGETEELPACYIRTVDNKVRYSMRRLEQEQDELFQL